jgi:hypothetical protein
LRHHTLVAFLLGFFLQVYRSSIRRNAMRRKNTSCSLFFWHDLLFFSGVETFHSPQRNAAKEYFVLAMAAMQVLLSLLALLGQRYKHCVAAKEHFFFWRSLWSQYRYYSVTTQITCFTSTKVQIMTGYVPLEYFVLAMVAIQVLCLLALPVQKYK